MREQQHDVKRFIPQNLFSNAGVYTWCSLCRLIRLLSTWCRVAAFFSASGAALSQEVPAVK
jgi:hypothetical protein